MTDQNLWAELRSIQAQLQRIEDRLTGRYYSPVRRCAVCVDAVPDEGREICAGCIAKVNERPDAK